MSDDKPDEPDKPGNVIKFPHKIGAGEYALDRFLGFYILEGHDAVKASPLQHARQFEERLQACTEGRDDPWRVALTDINPQLHVSTVFLGLNHAFHSIGPPMLFETMIFLRGDPLHEYQERCSTWDEAVAMHARGVAYARANGLRLIGDDES
jgi:hypothetical protein